MKVSLKQFDGPLDLLLSLVTEAKIDIKDIFVSEITEQYLASMEGVDELDMDAASEFLQMAATLIEIKSRSLLPKPPKEEEGEESPEEALIRQLTEYKAFKEASQDLKKLEEEAKKLFTRLPEEYPLPPPTVELTGLTLEALTKAFARVMARAQMREDQPEPREIRKDSYTVQACMFRIQRRVRSGKCSFEDLFDGAPNRQEIVTLFQALLELIRLGRVTVRQRGVFGNISIQAAEKAG